MISGARKLDPKLLFIGFLSPREMDPAHVPPASPSIDDQEDDDGHAWIYEKRMGKQASKCKSGVLDYLLLLPFLGCFVYKAYGVVGCGDI